MVAASRLTRMPDSVQRLVEAIQTIVEQDDMLAGALGVLDRVERMLVQRQT